MSILRSRRPARSAAASFVLAAGIAVAAAQPASAQVLVPVPPGCGSLSGTLVDASKLDDHSGDAAPIGTAAAPYVADLTFGMITIGTAFADHIQGNNGVDDTLCGLGSRDHLYGEGGLDHIFGGDGPDVIEGDSDADDLHGGGGPDAIYGDGGLDHIFGGDGADTLRGGADADDIHGGGTGGPADLDIDFADGQGGGATCAGVEDIDPTATVTPPATNPGPC